MRCLPWSLILAGSILTRLAWAAEPALPELQFQAPAVYPSAEAVLGREGAVTLELTVDATGRVERALVIQGASEAFDRAAVDAARDYRFEPARDGDGQPVGARVTVVVRFVLDQAPPLSVEGRVRLEGVRTPLGGLTVRAQGPGGERTTRTDEAGRFALAGLEPGLWTVGAEGDGLEIPPAQVTISPDEVAVVGLWAAAPSSWSAAGGPDEVVEVVSRATPEVTERRISAADIRVLPGSFGDVVRAVQNLPGVARSPFGIGTLVIRGTAPEDSRFSLDGVDLPLVFHFGGLTTVLNSDLLDEVVFFPGSFGVRYGRNQGGRVELRSEAEIPSRTGGYVSLDLFQATVFADIRFNARTAMSVSIRRSYAEVVLNPILQAQNQPIRAPSYWDGQLRVLHKMPGKGTLDAMVVVSDDRLDTLNGGQGFVPTGSLSYVTSFQLGRLQWRAGLRDGWRNELTLLVGPTEQRLGLGSGDEAFERRVGVDLREEIRLERDEGTGWRFGFDLKTGHQTYRYDVQDFGPAEEGEAALVAPALYLEPTFRWGPVTLVAGVRADLQSFVGRGTLWSIDPRVALEVAAGRTVVKASVGRFSQFPTLRQLGDTEGRLVPSWALQTSFGIEQGLPHGLRLEATAWESELFDQIVGREDRLQFYVLPPAVETLDAAPYASVGRGRAYGVDVLFKVQRRHFAGFLSATVSRSERVGRDEQTEALFAYDQPVVLNAVGTYELPRRWRIGGRIRFAVGNPYTPVAQRVYDLNTRTYAPIFDGIGGARLPPFWSLDLRVDKEWVFRKWAFSLYLDVQNVTNHTNIELPSFDEDLTDLVGVAGLPILPVFGLKGAW